MEQRAQLRAPLELFEKAQANLMKVLIEREEAAQIAREIIKEITNHVLEQTSEDKEKR